MMVKKGHRSYCQSGHLSTKGQSLHPKLLLMVYQEVLADKTIPPANVLGASRCLSGDVFAHLQLNRLFLFHADFAKCIFI